MREPTSTLYCSHREMQNLEVASNDASIGRLAAMACAHRSRASTSPLNVRHLHSTAQSIGEGKAARCNHTCCLFAKNEDGLPTCCIIMLQATLQPVPMVANRKKWQQSISMPQGVPWGVVMLDKAHPSVLVKILKMLKLLER